MVKGPQGYGLGVLARRSALCVCVFVVCVGIAQEVLPDCSGTSLLWQVERHMLKYLFDLG